MPICGHLKETIAQLGVFANILVCCLIEMYKFIR